MDLWNNDDDFFEWYWMNEALNERSENRKLRQELEDREYLEDELYELEDELDELHDLYGYPENGPFNENTGSGRVSSYSEPLTSDYVEDYDPYNQDVCDNIQDVINSGFYTKSQILRMYRGLDEKSLKARFNTEKLIPEAETSPPPSSKTDPRQEKTPLERKSMQTEPKHASSSESQKSGYSNYKPNFVFVSSAEAKTPPQKSEQVFQENTNEGMSAEEFDSYMPPNPPKASVSADDETDTKKGTEEPAPDQSKAKRKKRIILWSVIGAIIIAGIVIAIVMISNKVEAQRQALYDEAVTLVMEGNWRDSIDTFEELSKINYKGSWAFYLQCKGQQQYEGGDLKTAHKTLGQINSSDLPWEQAEYLIEYYLMVDREYIRRYGYDLPTGYKPSNSNSSSSSGTGSHSYSSGSNSSTKTDPYNAKDYANEDDFYEDYYNDFIDFDEAEQYWEEYGDDDW